MKRALDAIFRPKSVAVIGASTRPGTIGRETLHNILVAEFNGKVFPVNPKAPVIHSIKAYSTILDVPDSVDLAIVIVPKEFVAEVARQCGEKGVKGLVVISAGFSETGREGKKREMELVRVVQDYGMRMVGPNCFGIVNTSPEVNLNATFGKVFPKRGRVGFITQSGAMGEAIMNHARELGIGFSLVASIGNKADISSNDILEYFRDDPDTDIILMYLENFGNPRHFTLIARELSRTKPIVAVKSGRTTLGAKAASSHTGALAGLDVGVDALFDQTGVMRVDTVEELFDVAKALSMQPVPQGNRVAVVTNAGGPGILATDALINNGMEMPPLSPETVKRLRQFSSEDASFANPMDMVAGAGPEQFRRTLGAIITDKRYDSIIPIFVPPVTIDELEVARSIQEAVAGTKKTVLACFMGASRNSAGIEHLRSHGIPVYIYPEAIAKTLATVSHYRRRMNAPRGKVRTFEVDPDRVQAVIERARTESRTTIVGAEAIEILCAYGIPAAEYRFASSEREAAAIAKGMGLPVVMKVAAPAILHKTEVGGVMLDLRTEREVRDAFRELRKRVAAERAAGETFAVALQQMVAGGVETVMGMTTDPSFGPLIMFGLGGIYVEIMKDVAFRINPLTTADVRDMMRSLKSYPLLKGYRGAPPVDLATVEDTLLKVSQLVKDFDAFSEVDINPFIASPERARCKAVDARFIMKEG
ncbi:MAG TPA: acetate--CoA ligase family protein [candidate division Zixibacteria bacterium]|nr:acetate--CoA ligase family protein [candidate division Zixibacteria bacterium]MDD4918538.1 acetate--CoA ligase family protein [candidate division Zixibacteria bacterium]MDM7973408.1 acetate--CoA ligase family protein [candidate division Zixibacteria bacterium]HOZ06871.1 acetate--CoA ligase family protein [candidate division Zixibacteria bacterium]HPM37119.1 acetate--CoA ligase family protein [candidate division Zixibacteria bacterium]